MGDQDKAIRDKERIIGAAPAGARDEQSASDAVREMFTSIAPRYDLLNHVLSMNVDRVWWNRTARTFRDVLARPDAQVLDLCCGTGDMTFALHRRMNGGNALRRGLLACHAGAGGGEIRQAQDPLDRSRCTESALYVRSVSSGHLGIRLSQSGELRSRAGGDLSRARARWRSRHTRFRRAQGADRQESIACTSSRCYRALAR